MNHTTSVHDNKIIQYEIVFVKIKQVKTPTVYVGIILVEASTSILEHRENDDFVGEWGVR